MFPGGGCSPDKETALSLNDAHRASVMWKTSFTFGESMMESWRVCDDILPSLLVSRHVDYILEPHLPGVSLADVRASEHPDSS